jgi:hypothetical protein
MWVLLALIDLTIGRFMFHMPLRLIFDRNLDSTIVFLIVWFLSDKVKSNG